MKDKCFARKFSSLSFSLFAWDILVKTFFPLRSSEATFPGRCRLRLAFARFCRKMATISAEIFAAKSSLAAFFRLGCNYPIFFEPMLKQTSRTIARDPLIFLWRIPTLWFVWADLAVRLIPYSELFWSGGSLLALVAVDAAAACLRRTKMNCMYKIFFRSCWDEMLLK